MSYVSATLRTASDIVAAGLAPEAARGLIDSVARRYAVAITPAIAQLISANDDAIARQFLPDARELTTSDVERADPIGDSAHSPTPGVVHRYDDRALFKIASICPVYCRFCFRREMVGPEKGAALSVDEFAKAIDYFRATSAVREVILTGGDPFVLSPRRIRAATAELAAIPHIEKLRWHTRVPVVEPERVTAALIEALTASDKRIAVAVHANHMREFSPEARAAIARLGRAGISLISQTVLLKDINDGIEELAALMQAFMETGVTPYYLHHGDLAPGTSHFRTTIAAGRALMRDLASQLPADAMPRYVLDIPGGFGKVDLMSDAVSDRSDGAWRIVDRFGAAHIYRDAIAAPAVVPAFFAELS